jgi:hypothetical protein
MPSDKSVRDAPSVAAGRVAVKSVQTEKAPRPGTRSKKREPTNREFRRQALRLSIIQALATAAGVTRKEIPSRLKAFIKPIA